MSIFRSAQALLLHVCVLLCLLHTLSSLKFALNNQAKATFRFLESNSWEIRLGDVRIAVDPVMSQLDFGIPALYAGNRKVLDGTKELHAIAKQTNLVLISQGFDDHAHSPTLRRLSTLKPTMKYLVPPSAKNILQACGINDNCINVIKPGETFTWKEGEKEIEIVATTGALLGPPWQQKENGYIIRSASSKAQFPSIYYEPHCMYDENELQQYQADIVITPIVSQELPKYTLVAGGAKALKLAQILKAKYVIPMANGELKQSGLLSKLIASKGGNDEFQQLLKGTSIELKSAPPGEEINIIA